MEGQDQAVESIRKLIDEFDRMRQRLEEQAVKIQELHAIIEIKDSIIANQQNQILELLNRDVATEETDESNEVTCRGCRENQPNQLAHTSPGGCLYTDDMEGLY